MRSDCSNVPDIYEEAIKGVSRAVLGFTITSFETVANIYLLTTVEQLCNPHCNIRHKTICCSI